MGQISSVYTDSYLEFWVFFCSFFFLVYRITSAHSIGETHPMLKTRSSFLCLMLYDIIRNSDAHLSGNEITKKEPMNAMHFYKVISCYSFTEQIHISFSVYCLVISRFNTLRMLFASKGTFGLAEEACA